MRPTHTPEHQDMVSHPRRRDRPGAVACHGAGRPSPHLPCIAAALLSFGAVEAAAWWWMHPPIQPSTSPILSYHPPATATTAALPPPGRPPGIPPGQASPPHPDPSTSAPGLPAFQITPLPDLYRRAQPVLRCSSGELSYIALDDASAGLHVGWFEWDHTDPGSVLEAIIHIPDGCMGALGMALLSHEPPIKHRVGDHILLFDHTIYRDSLASRNSLMPNSVVHAFRAVWVAGVPAIDAAQGVDGRPLRNNMSGYRLEAALTRQRPTHARVIQAAVRGHHSTQDAWAVFHQTVLQHLTLAP